MDRPLLLAATTPFSLPAALSSFFAACFSAVGAISMSAVLEPLPTSSGFASFPVALDAELAVFTLSPEAPVLISLRTSSGFASFPVALTNLFA